MHNFQENISTFSFQSTAPGVVVSICQKFMRVRSHGFTRSEKASRLKSADKGIYNPQWGPHIGRRIWTKVLVGFELNPYWMDQPMLACILLLAFANGKIWASLLL
jgi:hypothetical protein